VNTLCALPNPTAAPSWREQAARIVEELFPVTATDAWNALLDLRGQLLGGADWNHTLDLFLACRERLESDHYLPFYRLRRLLTASLRLETGVDGVRGETSSLGELLRRNPRSLADVKRAVRRELFEHSLDLPAHVPVRVVERV
jgi:hypothetical protein